MASIQGSIPTLIKDGFFEDPDLIRRWALSKQFLDVSAHNLQYKTTESWPGTRCRALHEDHPEFAQEFIDQILTNVMRVPPCKFKANCSFQVIYQRDGDSWVHQDHQQFSVAGLVYLTPDPPPNSGTLFYVPMPGGGYKETDAVANEYNRLLIFDPQTHHKSDQYFGDTKENARLTLPFFIEYLP